MASRPPSPESPVGMEGMLSISPQRKFRDPAGSIEIRPDGAFRHVHPSYASDILDFLKHPLAAGLASAGRLISSEILSSPLDAPVDGEEAQQPLLLHPRISVPSYPWQPPPLLRLAAAEPTLTLCHDLLKEVC